MTFNTPPQLPTNAPRRKITTLGAVLIVIGSVVTVVVLVFAANLIGALMSSSDNVISHPDSYNKSSAPHELIVETLGWARDTARRMGDCLNNGV